MIDYANNINKLIKDNIKNGGNGDFFQFAPMTNTYYSILSSMLPDKKLNHCIDIGCFFGAFGNGLLEQNKITTLHNVDCSEEAIKIGQKKYTNNNISWEVCDAINFRSKEPSDIILCMGVLEKYDNKTACEILMNNETKYLLVSLTKSILKQYKPENLVQGISKRFKLYKETDYTIRYREQYENKLKPQTDFHKFFLFGKK